MTVATAIVSRLTDGAPIEGLRLVTLPMGVEDVVTMGGSFYAGNVFSPEGQRAVTDVVAGMLDKGTGKRDKFEIGALLEGVGASIRFSSDDYRVNFTARCLKPDVPLVLELLAEQLREPAFDADDLASLKKRAMGSLRRALENTDEQARIRFSQLLYPENHPNYTPSIEQQMTEIEAVTVKQMKDFHRKYYGCGSLLMVATGDINRDTITAGIEEHFGPWQMAGQQPPTLDDRRANLNGGGQDEVVPMPDKTSVDLVMGMAVGLDREHDDYLPLMMATYVLGGNFSARLMATVRDEAGLTYGIGSSVGGAGDGKDGYWAIHATFAPDLLERGRSATMAQFDKWLSDGATQAELEAKQATITGGYQVGLATTKGIAGAILDALERGRELSYLDTFPDEIRALTLDQVNDTIRRYIDPDRLTVVAAGTLETKKGG